MRILTRIAAFLLVLLAGASAQSDDTATGDNPPFSQAELDQMLAPVALYPDALLSQVLMAATYPLEVVEASRWTQANPGLKGEAAVQAVGDVDWDPSVKSLVAFPQVLQTMDQQLTWTRRLGDAFLAQQAQVMDTVQSLRRKAQEAGNLASNAQVNVTQDDGAVDIEPADPEVVYVPYYDPAVVYGPWWWPEYPPVFWPAWPYYGWTGGFAWGFGFAVGIDFFFGGCDWHHHNVYIHDHRHGYEPHGRPVPPEHGTRPWTHDPGHRHGVPYRNDSLNRQFNRAGAAVNGFGEFRGREPALLRGQVLPVNPPEGRSAEEARGAAPPPGRGIEIPQPNPHAFEGLGRGPEVRGFSERGHQSTRSTPPPRPAPPPAGRHH